MASLNKIKLNQVVVFSPLLFWGKLGLVSGSRPKASMKEMSVLVKHLVIVLLFSLNLIIVFSLCKKKNLETFLYCIKLSSDDCFLEEFCWCTAKSQ